MKRNRSGHSIKTMWEGECDMAVNREAARALTKAFRSAGPINPRAPPMKATVLFALGLAIAATATVTFAQATQASQPAAGKSARHAKIDTNGDGVIDRSEAAANPKMAQHFDRLDANRDGRITTEERPQHGGKGGRGGRDAARARMAELDTNQDGRFSRDELAGKTRALQNFAAIDANSDGFLTREEMQAHHRAHRGERGAQMQR